MKKTTVTILGAGLAGSLLSVMLSRQGFPVVIFEARKDPRDSNLSPGRSINLAMSSRGINALKYAGVFDQIEPLLMPMAGRMLHFQDGKDEFQPYGQKKHEVIYSVSRFELNRRLIDTAEKKYNVKINFEHSVFSYDKNDSKLIINSPNKQHSITAKGMIAADGAGSLIRRSYKKSEPINPIESILPHRYKELNIPANKDGSFKIEKNALHVWPRGQFMLIALPNPDGNFTLTLFMPAKGKNSFAELSTIKKVSQFFKKYFSSAVPLLPDLNYEFKTNPTGILGTVRCQHWHDKDKILLIGDAAHALVPFHAQGMNFAFDDCMVLDKTIINGSSNWEEIFKNFEAQQLVNANSIQDMALENYIEMRDGVLDPKFAIQKELSFELERRLPKRFIPRYSMVMFHNEIPYKVAQERGKIQQQLLQQLTKNINTLSEIDLDHAKKIVCSKLTPLQ